ncbi:hypothetical protein PMIN04_001612 [Paraphaeosphaeria minitans]
MPSAKNRRVKTARKKDQTALTHARKDSMMVDTPQSTIATTVENLHEAVDPNNNNAPEASRPDDMTACPYYVSQLGKKTFQSIGAVFKHWADQLMKEDSVYNAADPENPFHADWLMHQEALRKQDEDDAPPRMPYDLIGESAWDPKHPLHAEWREYQEAFRTGRKKDKVDALANAPELFAYAEPSGSKTLRAKDCSFWPLGTCRNGDDCRFYHDPAKVFETPKPCAALLNGHWRLK